MALAEKVISDLRIELGDRSTTAVWQTDELLRAIEKSVALMSRLMPKRDIVETTITRTVTAETLTIATNTGTLAYRPIKPGSVVITGKTLDTDYRINYLTGVVTEIGALLPDGAYTVSYELDHYMLDLTTLLPDYIKIERMECPVGETPLSLVTFDIFGSTLVVRGSNTTLDANDHARIIYLKKWTAPTPAAAGDYPSHLDDVVVIGAAGQALIFKAEKCMASCVINIDSIVTKLAEITALSITLPTMTPPVAPTLTFPDPPAVISLTDIVPPSSPSLSVIAVPADYSFVKPTSPSLPVAPTAPVAPTLSFTAVETALTAITTEITAAKAKLTSGETVINTGTRGEDVAANYGTYGAVVMEAAGHRVDEAVARLRQIEESVSKYASEVTSYGSSVNSYANNISGLIGKYREDINNEIAGMTNFQAQLTKYAEQVKNEELKVTKYGQEADSYQAQITEERMKIEKYSQDVASYQAQLQELALTVQLYGDQVSSYQVEVGEAQRLIEAYDAKVNAIINYASQLNNQVANYLSVAGRYLASGQAKINEFLTALGIKAEFVGQKASQEQRV